MIFSVDVSDKYQKKLKQEDRRINIYDAITTNYNPI